MIFKDTITVILGVLASIVIAFVLYGFYKVFSIYDEYVLLKMQSKGNTEVTDKYKGLYDDLVIECKDRVIKAVEHERKLRDAKDKINNPNSGIVTIPIGVRK